MGGKDKNSFYMEKISIMVYCIYLEHDVRLKVNNKHLNKKAIQR